MKLKFVQLEGKIIFEPWNKNFGDFGKSYDLNISTFYFPTNPDVEKNGWKAFANIWVGERESE